MNYLAIVNSVLVKLREDQVTAISDNKYSALIGNFANTVKDEIEDAWNWNALRNTITVNTVASTYRYTLTNAGSKSVILDVWNTTNNIQLKRADFYQLNRLFVNSPDEGEPYLYGVNGADANGDIEVDLYQIPDAVYSIDFNIILKQADLSSGTDIPLIPSNVLELGIWALAVSERGEDGGIGFNEIDMKYQKALGDAIALDAANMHPNQLTWEVC